MNSADVASLVPNPDDLLALAVEERGRLILKLLTPHGGTIRPTTPGSSMPVNHQNFFSRLNDYRDPPKYGDRQPEVDEALLNAWGWLENHSLLVKSPSSGQGWFIVTKEGKEFGAREDITAYQKASLLPKRQLHQLIAGKVYPAFLRGEYDTAVFQAFREVEIAVREAGNFGHGDYGTDLMRAAFKPSERKGQPTTAGPLTDTRLVVAEQEAMSNLFAGAIGLYKNPQSHRNVATEAVDAAEVIGFASHLLRIVDQLKPQSLGGAKP